MDRHESIAALTITRKKLQFDEPKHVTSDLGNSSNSYTSDLTAQATRLPFTSYLWQCPHLASPLDWTRVTSLPAASSRSLPHTRRVYVYSLILDLDNRDRWIDRWMDGWMTTENQHIDTNPQNCIGRIRRVVIINCCWFSNVSSDFEFAFRNLRSIELPSIISGPTLTLP